MQVCRRSCWSHTARRGPLSPTGIDALELRLRDLEAATARAAPGALGGGGSGVAVGGAADTKGAEVQHRLQTALPASVAVGVKPSVRGLHIVGAGT